MQNNINKNKNFKCLYNKSYLNNNIIYKNFGFFLEDQRYLRKQISPWETNFRELQHLKIDIKKIDRLYYLTEFNGHFGEFVARMIYYDNRNIYIYYKIFNDMIVLDYNIVILDGIIYLTENVNEFLNVAFYSFVDKKKIYNFFKEDNIDVYINEIFDEHQNKFTDCPTLKYVCLKAIFDCKINYMSLLPKNLEHYVTDFIRMKTITQDLNP